MKYSKVQFEYNIYTEVKLPDEEKYVFYNEKRTQTTAMVPAFY
jgi:hypothetical protein